MTNLAGFETMYFLNNNTTIAKTIVELNGRLVTTFSDKNYNALGYAVAYNTAYKPVTTFYDLQHNVLGTAETVRAESLSTTLYYDNNKNLLGSSKTVEYANGIGSTNFFSSNGTCIGSAKTTEHPGEFFTKYQWMNNHSKNENTSKLSQTTSKQPTLFTPEPEATNNSRSNQASKHHRCNII